MSLTHADRVGEGVLKEGRESTRGTPFPRIWFLSPPDRVRGEATRAGEPLKASKLGTNPVTRLPAGRARSRSARRESPREKRGRPGQGTHRLLVGDCARTARRGHHPALTTGGMCG